MIKPFLVLSIYLSIFGIIFCQTSLSSLVNVTPYTAVLYNDDYGTKYLIIDQQSFASDEEIFYTGFTISFSLSVEQPQGKGVALVFANNGTFDNSTYFESTFGLTENVCGIGFVVSSSENFQMQYITDVKFTLQKPNYHTNLETNDNQFTIFSDSEVVQAPVLKDGNQISVTVDLTTVPACAVINIDGKPIQRCFDLFQFLNPSNIEIILTASGGTKQQTCSDCNQQNNIIRNVTFASITNIPIIKNPSLALYGASNYLGISNEVIQLIDDNQLDVGCVQSSNVIDVFKLGQKITFSVSYRLLRNYNMDGAQTLNLCLSPSNETINCNEKLTSIPDSFLCYQFVYGSNQVFAHLSRYVGSNNIEDRTTNLYSSYDDWVTVQIEYDIVNMLDTVSFTFTGDKPGKEKFNNTLFSTDDFQNVRYAVFAVGGDFPKHIQIQSDSDHISLVGDSKLFLLGGARYISSRTGVIQMSGQSSVWSDNVWALSNQTTGFNVGFRGDFRSYFVFHQEGNTFLPYYLKGDRIQATAIEFSSNDTSYYLRFIIVGRSEDYLVYIGPKIDGFAVYQVNMTYDHTTTKLEITVNSTEVFSQKINMFQNMGDGATTVGFVTLKTLDDVTNLHDDIKLELQTSNLFVHTTDIYFGSAVPLYQGTDVVQLCDSIPNQSGAIYGSENLSYDDFSISFGLSWLRNRQVDRQVVGISLFSSVPSKDSFIRSPHSISQFYNNSGPAIVINANSNYTSIDLFYNNSNINILNNDAVPINFDENSTINLRYDTNRKILFVMISNDTWSLHIDLFQFSNTTGNSTLRTGVSALSFAESDGITINNYNATNIEFDPEIDFIGDAMSYPEHIRLTSSEDRKQIGGYLYSDTVDLGLNKRESKLGFSAQINTIIQHSTYLNSQGVFAVVFQNDRSDLDKIPINSSYIAFNTSFITGQNSTITVFGKNFSRSIQTKTLSLMSTPIYLEISYNEIEHGLKISITYTTSNLVNYTEILTIPDVDILGNLNRSNIFVSVIGYKEGSVMSQYVQKNLKFSPLSNVTVEITTQELTSSATGITDSRTTSSATGDITGSNQVSSNNRNGNKDLTIILAIVLGLFVILIIVIIVIFLVIRNRNIKKKGESKDSTNYAIISLRDQNVPQLTGIKLENKLGQGNFGAVYLGRWNDTRVAIKKLKIVDDAGRIEFTKECSMLHKIGNHPGIVQFLGEWTDKDTNENCMVFEYLPLGSCDQLLLKKQKELKFKDLVDMIISGARGMVFLSSKKIVHGDLAARNLLVYQMNEGYGVKISDFGMSKSVIENFYKSDSDVSVPVRWSAPEVLSNQQFRIESDVWSFGVVMWEILSFGKIPFNYLSNKQVCEMVPNGERLTQPPNCPNELWKIISSCWNIVPEERPTFEQILQQLAILFPEFEIKFENTNVPPPISGDDYMPLNQERPAVHYN